MIPCRQRRTQVFHVISRVLSKREIVCAALRTKAPVKARQYIIAKLEKGTETSLGSRLEFEFEAEIKGERDISCGVASCGMGRGRLALTATPKRDGRSVCQTTNCLPQHISIRDQSGLFFFLKGWIFAPQCKTYGRHFHWSTASKL